MPAEWDPYFAGDILRDFATWLAGLDLSGEHRQAVSLHELIFAYGLTGEKAFPVRIVQGTTEVASYPDDHPLSALVRPTLAASANLLQRALVSLFDFVGACPCFSKHARPIVNILCPVVCFDVGWPHDVESGVIACFEKFASHPLRHSRDFARTYSHVH